MPSNNTIFARLFRSSLRLVSLGLVAVAVSGVAMAACPVPPRSNPTDLSNRLPIAKLTPLLSCRSDDPLSDQSPCNIFAAKGLEALYSINDFKSGDKYMSASQIFDYVSSSPNWGKIGTLFDIDSNLCAQAAANQAYPVIAVMKASPHGHIALIIPGTVSNSGTWGMNVANSASFFIGQPDKSYISGPISKAFQPDNAKKAIVFYRKIIWSP